MKQNLRRIIWGLAGLLLISVVGFVLWAASAASPQVEALDALESSQALRITREPWLAFYPEQESPQVGLILYPGGRVDPVAYAPAARELAQNGFLVVIVPMPLNLAVFAPDKAAEVIQAYPEIRHWALGGHSLGGTMAARYVSNHPDQVAGLVLWASYPAAGDDLSDLNLAVTSIFGTFDGLASPEEVQAAGPLLPSDTRWVVIEGGNHAQFGWYGPQSGDMPAALDQATQQAHIIRATLELLEGLRDSADN